MTTATQLGDELSPWDLAVRQPSGSTAPDERLPWLEDGAFPDLASPAVEHSSQGSRAERDAVQSALTGRRCYVKRRAHAGRATTARESAPLSREAIRGRPGAAVAFPWCEDAVAS